MIRVTMESGKAVDFDDGHSWQSEGVGGDMFVFILDNQGRVLDSYPLDDVRMISDTDNMEGWL